MKIDQEVAVRDDDRRGRGARGREEEVKTALAQTPGRIIMSVLTEALPPALMASISEQLRRSAPEHLPTAGDASGKSFYDSEIHG